MRNSDTPMKVRSMSMRDVRNADSKRTRQAKAETKRRRSIRQIKSAQ